MILQKSEEDIVTWKEQCSDLNNFIEEDSKDLIVLSRLQ